MFHIEEGGPGNLDHLLIFSLKVTIILLWRMLVSLIIFAVFCQ